jgi:hypothetical protein
MPAEVPKDFSEFLSSTKAHLQAYVEQEKKHLVLEVADKAGQAAAGAAPFALIVPLFILGLLVLVIAGAKAWGAYLGNETLGYLYTGLVVVGACLLLFLVRKPMGKPVHAAIVRSAAGKDADPGLAPETRLAHERARRDELKDELMDHLRAIKDPGFRGMLVKDAIYDALRATAPFKFVKGLFARWNQ